MLYEVITDELLNEYDEFDLTSEEIDDEDVDFNESETEAEMEEEEAAEEEEEEKERAPYDDHSDDAIKLFV